jgi:hypothetical protein
MSLDLDFGNEHATNLFAILVLLLGIFRRVPRPSATRGRPCALLLPSYFFFFSFKINILLVIYDTSHQGAT